MECICQGIEAAFNKTVKEILGFTEDKRKSRTSSKSWKLINERKNLKKQMVGTKSKTNSVKDKSGKLITKETQKRAR